MLGMKTYPQGHIDACRKRTATQVAAFVAGDSSPEAGAAFFNNLVIVLDSYFMHRLRGVEGKDGNPLNEVRVLRQSMVENGEIVDADPTIKLNPETSVLGLKVGDTISLTEQDFGRLSEAYFAEIEKRFAE
ncbi:MAG: hypothetical protein JWR83_2930 [Aeromicrobium sp.]|nr:hypothetical protein [Aeromicrobium sp.]